MSVKINIGTIRHNTPNEDVIKRIIQQSYNPCHNHIWEPVKHSTDVVCRVCGIKAMQSCLRFKESEGE